MSYARECEILAAREGDVVEVTAIGESPCFVSVGPTSQDYIALARDAYLRDELSVEEFGTEVATHLRKVSK